MWEWHKAMSHYQPHWPYYIYFFVNWLHLHLYYSEIMFYQNNMKSTYNLFFNIHLYHPCPTISLLYFLYWFMTQNCKNILFYIIYKTHFTIVPMYMYVEKTYSLISWCQSEFFTWRNKVKSGFDIAREAASGHVHLRQGISYIATIPAHKLY